MGNFLEFGMTWFVTHPYLAAVGFLMTCDIVMGVLLAFGAQTLNSSISRMGMMRKAGTLLIVAVGFVAQPFMQGFPLGNVLCSWFGLSELISVLENGSKLGVKLPPKLVDALSKLRGVTVTPMTVRLEQPTVSRIDASSHGNEVTDVEDISGRKV